MWERIADFLSRGLAKKAWDIGQILGSSSEAFLRQITVVRYGQEVVVWMGRHRLPTIGDTVSNIDPKVAEVVMRLFMDIFVATLDCPADLLIIDQEGRMVGALYENGQFVREECGIPYAIYSGSGDTPQLIIIFNATGKYELVVNGRDDGLYQLNCTVLNVTSAETRTFASLLKAGQQQNYSFLVHSTQSGARLNFMPSVWSVVLSGNVATGGAMQIIINASDPEGISKVKAGLFDPDGKWHNSTADYAGGLYLAQYDTSGFPIGRYDVHISIFDDDGYVWTQTYSLRLLGRLSLSGSISKPEVVTGEHTTVTLTLKDQNESPVGLANVSVTIGGTRYVASYSSDGKYSAVVDTTGLEGSYVIEANAIKDMYLPAEHTLALVVRPSWWPYLPYAGIAGLAVVAISVAYLLRPKKQVVKIESVEDPLIKLLREAHELLEKGEYAKAVGISAMRLRSALMDSLELSKTASTEELISKVSNTKKDLDIKTIKWLLELGDRCTYAGYKPSKGEARKAIEASEKIVGELDKS